MKNKFMQIAAGTIFGLLLLIGSAQLFVSGQEVKNESSDDSRENFSGNRSIIGTWQTSVTPRNCQTGEPVAPAFPGVLTFNKGGTLTGTSTAVSSVYGVWERMRGWQNYSFAFISLRYSPTGTFIGTQKVRQTATLGAAGNSFTSTGSVEILDANGNTIGTGCSTSTGTRFE
ncbi:hypothetical protein BH24ACI2_BH24ACI2_01660 [soil metagenome]